MKQPFSILAVLVFWAIATAKMMGQNTEYELAAPVSAASSSNAYSSAATTSNEGSGSTITDVPFGPALPENIKLPKSLIGTNALSNWGAAHRLRFFGWANGGYTWSSTGTGLLNVAPRENRFGDAWLLNQTAFVLERTLNEESWSWGFRGEFYMGADAALLHPVNGFGPSDNPRFSTDFRQAYVSLHAPILTDGGIDFKFGRQYVPLGYETTMAPYRPMYSLSYVWLYSQNGATTGAIATVHVNPSLDVIGGVTLCVNSEYKLRGRAPCYIARALQWLNPDKRTKLVGTFYTGPQPIAANSTHIGKWQSELELQLSHDVNRRFTIVSETNVSWDTRDPGNKSQTSKSVGTLGMAIIHAHRQLDVNTRAEWFDDIDGSRIGTRTNYGEIASGINFMPRAWVNFRPEVRWDGADNPVFGPAAAPNLHRHQWTFAFETLVKF